ncbi:MAG: cysteine desulfurase family protein [Lutimonas sp.]
MQKIYLDNAATTPLKPEVVEVMCEQLRNNFGNPSSTHEYGRKARALLESTRKQIASYFKCSPSQVLFTSGGSEADNLVLQNAVNSWGIKRFISSEIEHHAVLHAIDSLKHQNDIAVDFVRVDAYGDVDLKHLKELLENSNEPCLVSLMMVNNEIGNLLNTSEVSTLCKKNGALFHSDTVQGIGHVDFNLENTPIDFIAASAHKFHGPKGVGFAIVPKGTHIEPLIHGGEQEMGTRAGTENTHSIAGMGKALQMVLDDYEKDREFVSSLKRYFIDELSRNFIGIEFNGRSADPEKGAYHILSVRFPKEVSMLLFNLDLNGIAASGGSACQSGSNKGSHVLSAILDEKESEKTSVRFSFSSQNTRDEIDRVIEVLKDLI